MLRESLRRCSYRLRLCVGLTAALWNSALAPARADDAEVYARIIVAETAVRSGPGTTYRRIYTAHRDEVFALRGRSARGYFFHIELPDGTHGYVQGDAVYNHEVGADEHPVSRFLPQVFAPPPLMAAQGEISFVAGALGSGGLVALRPTFLLDPSFGIELTAGASVARAGRLLLALGGPVVNLFPSSPVVPFFTLAGGVVASSPNADTFLLKPGGVSALCAGAGLRVGLRYRLTLRLEARTYVFFEADRYVRQEELSAGLSVFF